MKENPGDPVHSRPLLLWQQVGLWGVALAGLLCAPILLATGASEAILDAGLATPLPKFATRFTQILLLSLPSLVLPLAALAWARRRHGACQLGADALTFQVPGAGSPIVVPREDVSGFARRGSGIVVRVQARGRLAAGSCPLVIHLGQGDDEGAVLAYLEACGEVQAPASKSAGEVPPRWKVGAALPIVAGLTLLVPGLVHLTVVPAFATMLEETGIVLPLLTEFVVTDWVLVAVWIAMLLSVAVWGTWSKGSCIAACWAVLGLFFAIDVLALFLPLVRLMSLGDQ